MTWSKIKTNFFPLLRVSAVRTSARNNRCSNIRRSLHYSTPQTPSTSLRPSTACSPFFCSFLTRLTNSPTVNGPTIVHSMIAHVTTRKISSGPLDEAEAEENIPLLSAIDEIKNPISPRATIALPIIAPGYSEMGFLGSGEVSWAAGAALSRSVSRAGCGS